MNLIPIKSNRLEGQATSSKCEYTGCDEDADQVFYIYDETEDMEVEYYVCYFHHTVSLEEYELEVVVSNLMHKKIK